MRRKIWSLFISVGLLVSFLVESETSIFWIVTGTIVVLIDLYDLFKTKEKIDKMD